MIKLEPVPLEPPLPEHPFFKSGPTTRNELWANAKFQSGPLGHGRARQVNKLTDHHKAFENTSTSVAASQMRNALNNLADSVTDAEEKKVCPPLITNS